MHQRVLHYGKGSGNALSPWRVCLCVCLHMPGCEVEFEDSLHNRWSPRFSWCAGFLGPQEALVCREKKKSNFPNIKFIVTTQCFDWIQGFDWSLKGSVLKHQFEPQIKQTSNQTSCCWQNKNTERKLTLLHFCGNELMNSWTHELVVAEIFLYVQSSETDNIIIKWHHTHTHTIHTHEMWELTTATTEKRSTQYEVISE